MDLALINGDLEIKNGDFTVTDSLESSTAQAISIRLKTLKGEWFADTQIGIPWLKEVLGKKRTLNYVRNLIEPMLITHPEVAKIEEFNFEEITSDRNATLSCKIVLHNKNKIAVNESIKELQ